MWPFYLLLWSCCCCCCRLPLFVAAPQLIAAATLLLLLLWLLLLQMLQWAAYCLAAAPSAAGCTSCSAASAAPSCSAAAATAAACSAAAVDPGEDNSLLCISAISQARTCNHTIGTYQPTTVPARQDLINQARPGQDSVASSWSIVQTLIHSSDEDLQQTGRIYSDCPCPPIAVL